MSRQSAAIQSRKVPHACTERRTSRWIVVRLLLLFEASTFVAAATIHFGALLEGYGHRKAGIAETVIAIVLLAGLALTWRASPWPRRAAIGAQAFAIVGVLVGLFTIAIGVGPRTAGDIAYHVGILAVLALGLAIAARAAQPHGLTRPARTVKPAAQEDRR
jgi:heme A synthase